MQSQEYRKIVKTLSRRIIQKNFPGLKKDVVEIAATQIAANVYARLYGANVDNVDSPIWRDDNKIKDHMRQPTKDAAELLEATE